MSDPLASALAATIRAEELQRSLAVNAMVETASPDDPIAEGRNAWQRLKARERATFSDWVLVGQACAIGRAESLKAAKSNKPYGKTYNKFMGAWLVRNGLHDVRNQERYWALQIADNLDAISAWRETLDEADKRRLNHPQSIWVHWKASQAPKTMSRHFSTPARPGAKHNGKGRPIGFSQDMVRRAAMAMKDSRSADWFILARVGLEAAIRDESDLADLIPNAKRDAA